MTEPTMTVLESAWQRGDAAIAALLMLVPSVRIQAVRSGGLRFDTRFLVPADSSPDTVTLFLLLEGWASVELSGARRLVRGPVLLTLARCEFESRSEPRAPSMMVGGAPRRSIELCLGSADVHVPVGLAHGPMALPPELVAAGEHLIAGIGRPTDERARRCHALLDLLAKHRICSASGQRDATPTPAPIQRLVDAFGAFYRTHDSRAYAKLLASVAEVSVRQTSRDMARVSARFRLPGLTMRELLRVLRLRRAALLMSADALSLEELAREVGYGSLDALGRAFRDAKLPPPSELRAALSAVQP